jgi:hypothetical protein
MKLPRSGLFSTTAFVALGVAACTDDGPPVTVDTASQEVAGADDPERAFTAFESGQVRPLALSDDRATGSTPSTHPTIGSRSSASSRPGPSTSAR